MVSGAQRLVEARKRPFLRFTVTTGKSKALATQMPLVDDPRKRSKEELKAQDGRYEDAWGRSTR